MLFDCLIGNSDRHHSNWGVVPYIKKGDTQYHICSKLSPLYDNCSSLCAYEDNNDIISENMKKLLKMYFLERRKRMLDIYDLKDEV